MAHRSHALRSLKIEAWLWPPVKETGPRRCRRAIISGSQRRMELPAVTKAARSLKGSQSTSRRYATLRQRLSGSRFSCSRPPPAAASTRPLRAWRREKVDALFVTGGGFFGTRRVQLAVLAARYAVPASYSGRAFVEVGGLMSYGTNYADMCRQVGLYAAGLLKDAKPMDLPVKATRFELVINLIYRARASPRCAADAPRARRRGDRLGDGITTSGPKADHSRPASSESAN